MGKELLTRNKKTGNRTETSEPELVAVHQETRVTETAVHKLAPPMDTTISYPSGAAARGCSCLGFGSTPQVERVLETETEKFMEKHFWNVYQMQMQSRRFSICISICIIVVVVVVIYNALLLVVVMVII